MSKKRRTQVAKIQKETDYLLNTKFAVKPINPITKNQERLFKEYQENKNILAIGSAGTGKTYISLYLALKDVLENQKYKQIIIVRSSVQTRDQGHLPGTEKEKMERFEAPYVDIVNDLYDRGDGYEILKKKGMIKFISTSIIRGLSFDNSIILVDEVQSMNYHEIDTIITRLGQDSKIILCGDTRQDDLKNAGKHRSDVSGLRDFVRVAEKMPSFSTVKFEVDDVVRSGLVKEYILAKEILELAA